jgi:uncharacterized phage protein gp47/JayE
MALATQDFTTLVRNMVAAVQAGASTLLDMTAGSVLRAVIEAVASVLLWLQSLILQVLALTRAATSADADLDSWAADFGQTRLGADTATGTVTFSRYSPGQQAVVPLNTSVQTGDGSQVFVVALDITNPAYNAALGGYVLAVGTASVTVPVQAVTPGSGGNVLAGAVSVLGQAIPAIDTVSNAAAFANGADAETDAAFRTRLIAWFGSLSKATKTAVSYAVASVQQGLQVQIVENQQYSGLTDNGYFFTVVDDGSGFPSSTLLSTVNAAIEAVRGFGIRFGVFAPVVVTANVTMVITTAAGTAHATVVGQVGTALATFLNTLPLGASLPYTQLAALAYAVTGVTNVTGVLINGATADINISVKQVIKAGTLVVS